MFFYRFIPRILHGFSYKFQARIARIILPAIYARNYGPIIFKLKIKIEQAESLNLSNPASSIFASRARYLYIIKRIHVIMNP